MTTLDSPKQARPPTAHTHTSPVRTIRVLDLFSGTDADRRAGPGRLIITGYLGFLRSHLLQGIKRNHTITVNERTPPDKIAHEIRRRRCRTTRPALAAAWDDKHASDGTTAAREQLAATVAAHLGMQRQDHATDFHFDTLDAGIHGRVRVRSGTCESVFTVHVPHDRVTDCARLLGTSGHPH
jgi:hypothetical protein